MTAVDRLGFDVRLKASDAVRGARIAFLREVSNPAEARMVLSGYPLHSPDPNRLWFV
jgi:heme iron utilization protein